MTSARYTTEDGEDSDSGWAKNDVGGLSRANLSATRAGSQPASDRPTPLFWTADGLLPFTIYLAVPALLGNSWEQARTIRDASLFSAIAATVSSAPFLSLIRLKSYRSFA